MKVKTPRIGDKVTAVHPEGGTTVTGSVALLYYEECVVDYPQLGYEYVYNIERDMTPYDGGGWTAPPPNDRDEYPPVIG